MDNAKILMAVLMVSSMLFIGCKIQEDSQLNMGPASDSITLKEISESDAVNELESGEMDYYLSSLDSEQAAELKDNADISLQYAYS